MNKSAPPLLALALSLASAAVSGLGAAEPSYDCRKAATPTEKAICADGGLARLDRAIAAAFRQLKTELASIEEKPLAEEQASFLKVRDACGTDRACLRRAMEGWRAALRLDPHRPRNDPRERFVGPYERKYGWAIVRRTFTGDYHLIASQADPGARWVCDVNGTLGKIDKGSRAVATVSEEDGDKRVFTILVAIKRTSLVLEEDEPRLAGAFCGHNGTIDGSYQRVKKLDLSSES